MVLVKNLKFLVHDFGQKVKVFYFLCLSKKEREKVFAYVLDKKQDFKDYKNNCVRKTKNYNFSKGVSQSFWSKI